VSVRAATTDEGRYNRRDKPHPHAFKIALRVRSSNSTNTLVFVAAQPSPARRQKSRRTESSYAGERLCIGELKLEKR
jgi:hypothetical protein